MIHVSDKGIQIKLKEDIFYFTIDNEFLLKEHARAQ